MCHMQFPIIVDKDCNEGENHQSKQCGFCIHLLDNSFDLSKMVRVVREVNYANVYKMTNCKRGVLRLVW